MTISLNTILATAGVFIGCISSAVFLELLVKYDPGAGNLITFAQFAFVAIEGFIFTYKFGLTQRMVSFNNYVTLVIMFFMTSVCNNYAFSFNIPMPLHMIFRAGSLISNMLLGRIILRRSYTCRQYVSVLMISIGIFLCTYYSASSQPQQQQQKNDEWWLLGVLLLAVTLLVSSYMGIRQEVLYRSHGKIAREALFYTHMLPLPCFAFLYKDIGQHLDVAMNSPSIRIAILSITLPIMLLYLICNILTQYLCISSVYTLTTECSSLTVTLILTLRKFISLLFSILYFQNAFTMFHWLGTFLVFIGTLMFSDTVVQSLQNITIRKKIVKND